ncbi:DUF5677 domain-containing protein [Vibrio gazogenes]|uniref:Uncharacterized protein n=1 Tax=Vibrio gazogenes DSM 21264 = NBRC 103151 TaxID=1123492 RepID=A0A1M4V2K0_VIBGA|nr:DUF5677 domain-containing protein [Vibrio gazogenes]USP15630.1 DUF5677 domain-containing protein [Vibrio gazogenes]SHE63159.1 hypothetical protein SAMN02745781_00620 [Vibrio gazogenes DSM 21264] [Vibrio gazogenes DSM 21264 = NBRC 103151]SJN54664.1 hypothetical protein BQ6471_01140 [Vibrio gazogenes]
MNYLSEFRKKKGLDKKLDLSNIQVALECAAEANKISYDYIAYIDNKTEKDSFIVHTHLNLIGRIYEQVEGMLCCIATQSFTSAEALGRVVQESSINLMYMALNGDERTITAYMAKWYDEHLRKLNEWKKEVATKDYSDKVIPLIDGRISAISHYSEYIELAKNHFSVVPSEYNELWFNSLFKRFEKLGKTVEYFSIYHRLSGSSHMTAEDTILFMMMLQYPLEARQLVAFEACSYSIMMSRVVTSTFIEAMTCCCIRHNMLDEENLNKFKKLMSRLGKATEEISKDAGIPSANDNENKERIEELQHRLGIYLRK